MAIGVAGAVLALAAGIAGVTDPEMPAWWVVLLSVVAYGAAVWLLCALSQYRVWEVRREATSRAAPSAEYPGEGYAADCARHCGRWAWALRHPFNGQTWPDDFTRRHPRPSD